MFQWLDINICEPLSNAISSENADGGEAHQPFIFPSCEPTKMSGPCDTMLCQPELEISDVCHSVMTIHSTNEHILHRLVRLSEHSVELLKVHIDRGADVNRQDEYGRTALMQAAYKNRVQAMELLLVYGRANMEIETYHEPRLTVRTIAVSLGHSASLELLALAERGELELSKDVAHAANIDRKSLPADRRRVAPPGPQQRYQQQLLRQRERAPQPPPRMRGLCDTLPCSEDVWCEPELNGYAENSINFPDVEAGATADAAADADAAAMQMTQTGAEVGELINRTPSGNDRRMVPQWDFFEDGSSPAADSHEERLKSTRGRRSSVSKSSPRGSGTKFNDQDATERLLQRQNQTRELLGRRMTDEWEKQLRLQYAGVDQATIDQFPEKYAFLSNYSYDERVKLFGLGKEEIKARRDVWLRRSSTDRPDRRDSLYSQMIEDTARGDPRLRAHGEERIDVATNQTKKKALVHRKKTQKEVDEDAVFEERYGNLMHNSAWEKGFSVSYNLVDHKKAADGRDSD